MFKKLEEQSEICKIKNLLPDYNGNNYDVLITSYCDSPKVLGSKKVIILPNIHFEEDKLQIILILYANIHKKFRIFTINQLKNEAPKTLILLYIKNPKKQPKTEDIFTNLFTPL